MIINPIVGVYIPIIRIPVIKGWRSPIPKDQQVDTLAHLKGKICRSASHRSRPSSIVVPSAGWG